MEATSASIIRRLAQILVYTATLLSAAPQNYHHRDNSMFQQLEDQIESYHSISRQLNKEAGEPSRIDSSDFVSRVVSHSRKSMRDSLYPRNNYSRLAEYLVSPQQLQSPFTGPYKTRSKSPDEGTREKLQGTIHTFNPHAVEVRTIKALDSPEQVSKELSIARDISDLAFLIFLCGIPTPSTLSSLGMVCHLDPEFLRRHLQPILEHDHEAKLADMTNHSLSLFSPRGSLTKSSLPSTSQNIIHLQYTSFVEGNYSEMQILTSESLSVSNFPVRGGITYGNYASIQQQISICVENLPTRGSWLGELESFMRYW